METNNFFLKKKYMITGGAGFIGSSLIRFLINETKSHVLNFDKLTYASNTNSLKSIANSSRYKFIKGDICDKKKVFKSLNDFKPDIVMNLAAETHVDRSIEEPYEFIKTNIEGTLTMLECSRKYWNNKSQKKFIFHQISTDEVFGSLNKKKLFNENSNYDPSSPYSASKAGSDHLVRAWHRTYGLPVVITNCSNNYGPYQFPEKLIPLIILNALDGKPLPVYGNGKNIRDWLFVEDHVRALYTVVNKGKIGETYNIGSFNEKKNIDVVISICEILDDLVPLNNKKYTRKNKLNTKKSYKELITFVKDRPGHDFRYAVDATKIQKRLKWQPRETFNSGLKKTIEWYLKNIKWYKSIK